MSAFRIFDIAGSGMSAQMIRLNATASNLANAESMVGNPEDAYRARYPVFKAVYERTSNVNASFINGSQVSRTATVDVISIYEKQSEPTPIYRPDHPSANEEGYVFSPNVNAIEEVANMISASRSYQNNVEVLNASKELLLRTLNLGRS